LSTSAEGLGKLSVLQVPLVPLSTGAAYNALLPHLGGISSLVFAGTGFSGGWFENDTARLVIQLNGPLTDVEYFQCIGLSINKIAESSSCGNGFHVTQKVQGGFTVELELPSIQSIEPSDRLELTFVLGTDVPEGQKVVPNLVFGGDASHKVSYLEIGSDR
jgi:hypothetical protein